MAADAHDRLAVELGRLAGADDEHAPGRELARRGQRGRVALGLQLAEGREGAQLAARPPIQLIERPFEGRLADDRDDQDVRGDIPGLVVDDS